MATQVEDARAFFTRAQTDPCWFITTILGGELWSKQTEILESVRDHPRTAVQSCHGPGKTKTAARAALWFLAAHPNSRVITTAPTWRQVRGLLWREIHVEYAAAERRFPLGGRLNQVSLELAADWFADGRSTREPENFQGEHADHLLLIADEASGISNDIFEAAEGYMTGGHARMLLLGNPTQPAGQFYDASHRERALWNVIRISVFDTPNFTGEPVSDRLRQRMPSREWVVDKLAKWLWYSPEQAAELMAQPDWRERIAAKAAASLPWQVRVLGEFPSTADDTVIPMGVVEAAQERYRDQDRWAADPTGDPPGLPLPGRDDEKVLGVDVARFGSDETVIAFRHGNRIQIMERYNGNDTVHTTGRVMMWRNEVEAPRVVVDDDGIGGAVTDQLRAQGAPVEAFRGGASPFEPLKYPNRRSEHWFEGAQRLRYCALDPDEQLLADLVAPKYGMTGQGQRVVERKQDTKQRLGRSPDRADAVLLTLVPGGQTGGKVRAGRRRVDLRASL